MPAFGSLTGGLDAHHPEIMGSVGDERRSAGAGLGPTAALPAGGLAAAFTSIAIAPVGESSSRAIAGRALAEGRRLQLVARGVAVELEALRFGRVLQSVEMRRRDRRCPHRGRTSSSLQGPPIAPLHRPADRKAQAPRLRGVTAVPKPSAMIDKASLLVAAACSALIPCALPAQPIDPKVQARIDRILKAHAADRRPQRSRRAAARELRRQDRGPRRAAPTSGTEAADDRHGAAARRAASAGNSGRSTSPPKSRATARSATRSKRSTSSSVSSTAYPRDLEQAYTADDVVRIHKAGRVASLIGVEGGHQMGAQLCRAAPVLRSRRPLHDADPLQDHRVG